MIYRLDTSTGRICFIFNTFSTASGKYKVIQSQRIICDGGKITFALSVFSGSWVGQAESKRSPEPLLRHLVTGQEEFPERCGAVALSSASQDGTERSQGVQRELHRFF